MDLESRKRVLVTGCFGMDGSHMVDLLLSQGHFVVGSSYSPKFHHHAGNLNFIFSAHDIRDSVRFEKLVNDFDIEEVYNFAGISYFRDAQNYPDLNYEINRNAVIQMAECCARKGIKFVQCSSSEIFPDSPGILINESSSRSPSSAYAIAKHEVDEFMEGLRRSGHQMYNAILFSHESERRKPVFLVRKISMGVARIYSGEKDVKIGLGDLTSCRDWSPARHFIDWIYAMTKYDPDVYILASGISHSVEDVLQIAFRGIGIEDWQSYVIINQDLGRPPDRNQVIGDPSKIEQRTGILRNEDFEGLIRSIVEHDINGRS